MFPVLIDGRRRGEWRRAEQGARTAGCQQQSRRREYVGPFPALLPNPVSVDLRWCARYLPDHALPHKSRRRTGRSAQLQKGDLPPHGQRAPRSGHGRPREQLEDGEAAHADHTNRCLALLSHTFKMARVWGVLPAGHPNPCADAPRFPENKRERFLSELELAQVGQVLRDAQEASKTRKRSAAEVFVLDQYVVAAIRLLIFTGLRPSDACELRWDQVDLEGCVLHGRSCRASPVTRTCPPRGRAPAGRMAT